MTFFNPPRNDEGWTRAQLRMFARALECSSKAETSDLSDAMPRQEKGDSERELEREYELVDHFIDKICCHNIVLPKGQTEVQAKEEEINWNQAIFSGLLSAVIFILWFSSKIST
jgi:hypothetical protein